MNQRIYAIAINTFREAVRDKVLYGVLGGATAVLLFTLALAELSLNEEERIITDVGLASISLFSVCVAVFLGSSLLYKEIERKTLYVILPKPIHRWEFLVGKYVGILITTLVFIAVMGAVQLWVLAIQSGVSPNLALAQWALLLVVLGVALRQSSDRTAVLVPWSLFALGVSAAVSSTTNAHVATILAALTLSAAEVMVVAAVAMLFSSFSTPFLTGLLTLGVWLAGRSADDMVTMRPGAMSQELRSALRVVAEVVPNFNLFVPGWHTLTTTTDQFGGPWTYVATTVLQGALYASILLVLASVIFRRRDFL